MNKEEFLNQLRSKLNGLPQEDIEERVSFYREMIEDRVDDGATEEEAVSEIGPVDEIVKTIMSEIPLTKLVKTKVNKPKKQMPGWAIALLIIGFPVWFPILITAAALIFSFIVTIWSVIFAFYAGDFAVGMASIACVLAAVAGFTTGKIAFAVFCIGAAMILASITLLWFVANYYMVKGVLFLTKKMILWIKSCFIGKE